MTLLSFDETFRIKGKPLDEHVRDLVQKYAMGQDIAYQSLWLPAQEVRVMQNGQPTNYNIPVLQVFLGIWAGMVGKPDRLWYMAAFPTNAEESAIEKAVLEAMENLRNQKAQLNGVGLLKQTRPFPKLPPGERGAR